MTLEEIKKAFNICHNTPSCTGCPMLKIEEQNGLGCKYNLFTSVIELINKQEEEIKSLKTQLEQPRKETVKEILILLGKGFDETKMTEFKNLPWYKLFCRELKQKYSVEVE